jgi:flagellar FliJ protein
MKSIETLIKINKQALDEKRQELVELESQKEQLIQWQDKMKQEMDKESEFVSKNPEMSFTFGFYRELIKGRQANLKIALEDINTQIDSITEEITEIFGEMKKYEIVEQQKLRKILKEQKYKETKALDEIALNNYLKEQKN